MRPNRFPEGWNADRVEEVLRHYEQQAEEEAVAEDQAAFEAPDQAIMVVPHSLVPTITRLIGKEAALGLTSRRSAQGGAAVEPPAN